MVKVLQLGMTDNLGGIETFLINYYRNIDKTKVSFDFVNIYNNDLCFKDEIEKIGGKIYRLPSYYKHPLKYLFGLKKIINNNRYDIIHCNMNSAAMIFPLLGSKISKTNIIICHAHNASSDKGFIKSFLHHINKHFIPLLASHFFSCSDKAGKWFFSSKIRASNNYYIINNAIDTKKFLFNSEIRKQKRKELNIDSETFVIGNVGRFVKQKNHKFMIDVFNDIYINNPNSMLLLVGRGPLEKDIFNKVNKLKLHDNVLFLGQREDVNELYNVMDCFILPSLYEGLPLVGVEAQTNGLKCFFSDKITNTILISDESKMISIKKHEHFSKEIKKSGFERVNIYDNPYDIVLCSKKLENIYDSILKGRK